MKTLAYLLLVLALGFPMGGKSTESHQVASSPNILVILVDDMGFSDLGCYGSEISTPNLDALAADGLRFTQFYNGARCCPSRAAILTGLYPHQTGLGHMVQDKGVPGYRGRLNDRCVTIAEVLRGAGYFTAMSGKWHVGENFDVVPWDRGFDRSLAVVGPGIGFYHLDGPKPRLALNGKLLANDGPELPKDWYTTDVFTDYGLKFIDEALAEKKPFFLYLAYNAPHFPLQAPAEDVAKYRGKYKVGWDKLREQRYEKQIRLGIIDKAWTLSPRPEEVKAWDSLTTAEQDRFDQIMAVYAACVDHMDQAVGRVVEGLRQRGVLDNTLILFLSDNGGNAEKGPDGILEGPGAPGSADSNVYCGESWATLQNTPFRLYKHYIHEGGISTPFIAHWPARIAAKGELRTQPGHIVDIMTTCVDVAGATYPAEFNAKPILPMEGRSLLPAFANQPIQRDALYWEHEGNAAVRVGDWKLVRLGRDGLWELYDMKAGRTELNDLTAKNPEVVKEFAEKWESWAVRTNVKPYPGQQQHPFAAPAARPEPPSTATIVPIVKITASSTYAGNEAKNLTDGMLSEANDKNYWASDPQKEKSAWIILDLGEKKEVGDLTLQFRQVSDKYIFATKSVTVELSDDGKNFTELSTSTAVPEEGDSYSPAFWEYPVNAQTRYLRIRLGPSQHTNIKKWAGMLELTEIRVLAPSQEKPAATAPALAIPVVAVDASADSSKARFNLLPFGSIRPEGWIKAQLNQDASDGCLAYYHRNWAIQNKAYELRGHNPAKKDKQSDFWDGAAEGYWGLALISSSILADDPALKQRADEFVAAILKSQDPDGYLGIHDEQKRYQPGTVDRAGHIGFMLQGLLDYAQAYNRKDVLDAVERAVQCDMRNFNKNTPDLHASGFLVMSYPQFLDALAQATGKKEYADYAAFLIESYNTSGDLDNPIYGDCKLPNLLDAKRPFFSHACNTTGNLSLPWLAYYATGDQQYKQAGENAFAKFDRQMSVSGSLPGDEDNQGREPSPDIGIEFCSTSYLVENSLIVGEKTGGSRYFDITERALFNAGQGARLPDGTAHAYLKRDNEFTLEYPGIFHREQYSPAQEPFCCTLRMISMMPAYISHMFMKTADDKALAAVCYGPVTVETEMADVKVRVEEKTLYPFESKIEFYVQAEKPVAFNLMVRAPTWSPSAEIRCEGATASRQGEYYVVTKQWGSADVVTVTFETPVETIRWENNEYVLKSGPLVFAANLGTIPTQHDTFPSGHTIQELSDGKLPIYGFSPKNPRLWHASLDGVTEDPHYGFKRAAVKTQDPDQPWAESPLVLKGEFNRMRGKIKVNLVPMGCTVLRRVTFPVGYVQSEKKKGTMVDENTSE
ncbi:MAG: sulfatase-like hydrolase/transferase [Kiritimatiellales bacterium]|nr:sulfatase-like hydrolase/transferase [Kiritimatiellales bacterium]